MKIYKNKKYVLFGLISLVIAYMYYITPTIYDDSFNKAHANLYNSLAKDWHSVYQMYFTWSSRTIVNFFMYQLEVNNKILFAVVTGAFFFLMLFSVSSLLNDTNNFKLDISISFALMTIPFSYYSTAGWIATMATYLFPISAATFALTSIFGENNFKSIYKKILLFLATLYAANNEQVLIVLVCIFATYSLILIKNRSFNSVIVIQDILLFLDMLWFMLSPGNKNRSLEEVPRWFPQFAKMNILNKLDMGFTTTTQHILFANLPYMALIVIVPIIFYTKKLKNDKSFKPYLITSVLTFVIWLTYSIMFDLSNFTHSRSLVKLFSFPKEGLFTSGTFESKKCILSFLIYFIFIALLLFNYSFKMKLDNYFLLLAAFLGALLSRVALGFSATNYVSATRTFSVMATTLVILLLFMLRKMTSASYYKYLNMLIVIMAMVNIFVMYWQIVNGNLGYVPLWVEILGA
ncbi:MAG: DUF6056 family protein [Limosilactobacillus vaginalis]|uniref:DUF6056 family protein n=1 Tax=Limosilactobacillus vaginalis TaxID=1633 RepID=UPI003EFF01FC